jgi:hypothetical protein
MFIPDPNVFSVPDPGYETLEKKTIKTITDGTAVKIFLYILRSMLCQLWSSGLQQNQVHQESKKIVLYYSSYLYSWQDLAN